MKIEHIEPFIEATQKAFQEVMSLTVKPDTPRLYDTEKDILEVTALIGLAGEARGAVLLSFSQESCLRIAALFIGHESTTMDDDVSDAIGELVNIIAGNAKEGLIQFRIYISLPKVITSPKDMKLPKSTPAITVPFTCEQGPFQLTVALQEEKF